MRRYLLGVALLVLLPVLSLPVSRQLSDHHRQIGVILEQAAQKLTQGQGEAGRQLAQQAYDIWEEKRHYTAAFVHHAPLEEIDCLFAAAQVTDNDGLAVYCKELAVQIYEVADGQSLNWWGLL